MVDTQRTRAAILALFADNVTGQISAQDLRDFVVTIMETDFVNPGDFWAEPKPEAVTAHGTVKGWIKYSQIIVSTISFGRVVYMTSAGWAAAGASATADHAGRFGVTADSYTAAESQAQILLKGIVFNSNDSAVMGSRIGNYIFLASGQIGGIRSNAAASVVIIGYAERSAAGDVGGSSSKWFFDPQWGVAVV